MLRSRYKLPSTSTLTAFECAARHLNFSRAAEELHTSQSAISRHVAGLEQRLNVQLFLRTRRRLKLTEQGQHLLRAVVSGLDNIQSALEALAAWSPEQELTIFCTHEISHLYLLPRFETLQAHLGAEVQIRILTAEYDAFESDPDPRIDLAFRYGEATRPDEVTAVVADEAICPLCSPQFWDLHGNTLAQGVAAWRELPFLRLTKTNKGWATWEDWFEKVGVTGAAPGYIGIDNYVYLLESCMAGRGIALGWRGLVERYLESGALKQCWPEFVAMDQALRVSLTATGQTKDLAWACLDYLRDSAVNVDRT